MRTKNKTLAIGGIEPPISCIFVDRTQRPRQTPTSFPGSLGKTLVAAGHVPRPKLIARGGVVKVSNYKQLS